VPEKDREDQLAQSREKLSFAKNQRKEEYPTNNKKKEGLLDLSHLA
jgi:hypothetical protein